MFFLRALIRTIDSYTERCGLLLAWLCLAMTLVTCGVVLLHHARMKHANPAQLQRVRSRCREVCQWISGEWQETGEALPVDTSAWHRLACDPKRFDGFRDASTGAQVDSADWVLLSADGCFYLNQEGS